MDMSQVHWKKGKKFPETLKNPDSWSDFQFEYFEFSCLTSKDESMAFLLPHILTSSYRLIKKF
jgi:hypothetical protein